MTQPATPKLSPDLQRHLGRCLRAGTNQILHEPLRGRIAALMDELDAVSADDQRERGLVYELGLERADRG
jgi:hypothetical protein